MSHPSPPQTTSDAQAYARAVRTAAIVAVVACPALALLPPRKLDLYTLGLVGTTAYSASYLVRESTGRSVWEHLGPRVQESSVLMTEEERGRNAGESVVGEMQRELRRGQRETWKVQRQREIEEDVEEGKGFGEMIMDQIWEVWNWGKRGDEREGEGDQRKES